MERTDREWLLGFDAREPAGGEPWDARRKESFLFRLDVQPLSSDRNVWPSVFDAHPELKPAWTGPYDYWDDLAYLLSRVEAARLSEAPWIAAFSVSTAGCGPEEQQDLESFLRGVTPDRRPGTSNPVICPSAVDPRWDFLGYDVADLGGGISALANCGFLPSDSVGALRARWGPRLNEWHLFSRLADAVEFRAFADHHVAEHAPFFVHGLWRI